MPISEFHESPQGKSSDILIRKLVLCPQFEIPGCSGYNASQIRKTGRAENGKKESGDRLSGCFSIGRGPHLLGRDRDVQ